jgi:hypothetical protein
MAVSVGLALAGCRTDRLIAEDFGSSSQETCGNGFDDDGNGAIDDGCVCGAGETQACFSRELAQRRLGECSDGEQRCDAEGAEFGQWGRCEDDLGPAPERCDGEVDDDCDGAVDEGCPCGGGQARPCATAYHTGPCRPGEQTCRDGLWSDCRGAVAPRPERCGDGTDDDCDGAIDERCGCEPVPEACADGIDNDCDGVVDEPACLSSCDPEPEVCDNGLDDDCDETVDEPDCQPCGPGLPGCEEVGELEPCAGGGAYCGAGLGCTEVSWQNTPAYCLRFCSTGGDCDSGICFPGVSLDGESVSFCAPACDPLTGGGCGGDFACYVGTIPEFGAIPICGTAGTLAPGDACGPTGDACVPGYNCANGACAQNCRVGEADCDAGTSCAAFVSPLVIAGVEYGACG